MKIIALMCPQCGANLNSDKTNCDFCGTTVRLSDDKEHFIETGIVCPNCGANNQLMDKHCGSCGEKLIDYCPMPNCLEPNSVWRKFCKKCGKNIVGIQIEILENELAECKAGLDYHTKEIDRINGEIAGAKYREIIGKILIVLFGGIIIVISFIGKAVAWAFIVGIITILVGLFYNNSSEKQNLFVSMALHQDDVERLYHLYKINTLKLRDVQSKAKDS